MKIIFRSTFPYRYKLVEDFNIHIAIFDIKIDHPYMKLSEDGFLTIKAGYAWNGSSGLSIDTKTNYIASLVHDALYQLMRLEKLPVAYRKHVDIIYREICLKAKMLKFRANYSYFFIRWFAAYAAKPGREMYPRPIMTIEH